MPRKEMTPKELRKLFAKDHDIRRERIDADLIATIIGYIRKHDIDVFYTDDGDDDVNLIIVLPA